MTHKSHFTPLWPALAMMIALALPASAQQECSITWTLDGDFDDGVAINLGSGDGGELVLNTFTTPLPFVYVANSARGTAVRIDVNTGAILGEYLTAPNGMGRDPSRTTVDKFGNVWVSNRAENGFSGSPSERKGSIVRIGVIIGGTRGNKNGDGSFTDDPNGQYLRPPFLYSTVTDRDGDGYIKTSRGLGNILPWTNTAGANTHGGVSTADDEAIINYTRIAGSNARTVAVDANNDVWTGGLGDLDHEKVSGVTGLPIPGTRFNTGCGGYGGLVDGNNVLWSARGGSNLLRYDANTPVPPAAGSVRACLNTTHGDYGLGIDPSTGEIWHSSLTGNRITKLSPTGAFIQAFPHGNFYAQGVAVDASGNVWVAHALFGATTVGHLKTNGLYVGNVTLPGGSGPTGVAVDANGKVWVTNISSNNAMRIDPNAGPIGGGGFPVGAVDLTVNLGAGAGPYNYSDMTGFVSLGASSPSGSWTIIKDGGVDGGEWGVLTWTGEEPAGTEIKVEVRAADNQIDLASLEFTEVESGVSFCDQGIAGQFIEIRVTLSRSSGDDTPVLESLTLGCCNEPPVAVCRDIEVAVDDNCMAEVNPWNVDGGSSDPDGEGETPLTFEIEPAGPFGLGVHNVTLTVTDADGATDECQASITVVDDTDPVIANVGSDESITCPSSPSFSSPTASDNCDSEVALEYEDSPTAICGNTYVLTRTWTATDDAGNTAQASQTITVVDETAPELTISGTPIDPWPANHTYTTVTTADVIAAISDGCDDDLALTDVIITSVSSDEPEDASGGGDGNTLNDIVISSDCKSVDLRVERSGSGNGRVYRIHCAVTDACGNTGTASFPVSVRRNNGGSAAVEDAASYSVDGTCGGAGKLVAPGASMADGYSLEQNVPNPFTRLTEIPFTMAVAGKVTISMFDASGVRIATVLDEEIGVGAQTASFDGSALASGTYYCVLESGGVKLVRRMTLTR